MAEAGALRVMPRVVLLLISQGTSNEQDGRFTNKVDVEISCLILEEKKLLATLTFPIEFDTKIVITFGSPDPVATSRHEADSQDEKVAYLAGESGNSCQGGRRRCFGRVCPQPPSARGQSISS